MKMTVTESMFVDAFDKMNRAENFSRDARRALFEYMEESETDNGAEYELDVIELCCDWSEYASAVEAVKDYSYTPDEDITNDDEKEQAALEWLQDETTVITFDGGILVMAF